MTTDWNQEIHRHPALRGWHTTPAGLLALSKIGVTLTYDSDWFTTYVRKSGEVLGTIRSWSTESGSKFGVGAFRPVIDMFRPTTEYVGLDDTHSHDHAIEQVLRLFRIQPPARQVLPNTARVVCRPEARYRVRRAYSWVRHTPESDMPEYARLADSIATRIRMNSARTDPMTGVKAKIAPKAPAQLSPLDRLRKIYGKRLTVHRKSGGSAQVMERNLAAVALAPDHHHRLVFDHMSGHMLGGIHIGNKHATRMKDTQPQLISSMGGKVLSDRPNDHVGGVYYSGIRQMVVPDTQHSGSVSTGSHEFGHALDYAWGYHLAAPGRTASSMPRFQALYAEVHEMPDGSPTRMYAYYTDKSTGDGKKEMWAEGYAAWLVGRDRYESVDDRATLIGHSLGVDPDQKLRVGRLLWDYFEEQNALMEVV